MLGIVLGGLINPYGVDAMTYVLRSYGINLINAYVPEMFAPSAQDLQGKLFYVSEAAVIFTLAKFKTPWRYVFLSGGIIFLAMLHTRNLILFYFLATLPIAHATRNFSAEKFFMRGDDQKNFGTLTLLFFVMLFANTVPVIKILDGGLDALSLPLKIAFTAATLFMLYNLLIVRRDGRILHPTILPRKILSLFVSAIILGGIFATTTDAEKKSQPLTYTNAIEFLLRTERPENISLYVPQGIGGLAGSYGIRYYIDSRSEVFLAANNGCKDIFAEYVDFISGKLDCEDFFGRYDFTHIIITNDSPFIFDALSRDKNFRVIYESEHVDGCDVVRCKIFVPKGRD
jgi:hypothetical protein